MARFAAGDERHQEDPGRQERRRDPEQRELDVPRPREVVGEQPGQIQAEEFRQIGAVMFGAPRRALCARNSTHTTTKNQMMARCAGVRLTSPGGGRQRGRFGPCQPTFWLQRP